MFTKELNEFKKKVENEMIRFFGYTPNQVMDEIIKMKETYMEFCDLDGDSLYGNLSPEYKEILVKYKTLLYFNEIYGSLLELEDFVTKGGI